jgi:hypothetical protein
MIRALRASLSAALLDLSAVFRSNLQIFMSKFDQSEYLVISRGQWKETLVRDEIENVIEQFYIWIDRSVKEGRMKRGQRLTYEGKTVLGQNVITDGPFGESKEVIGGYWFIIARSLDEAAQIASANPCLKCGLFLEIRPVDPSAATPDNTR